MNPILEFLQSLIEAQQLKMLIYLIVANLILGVVAAIINKTFVLEKVVEFWKKVATVLLAYLAVAILAKALTDFKALVTIVQYALIAYMTAKIIVNLRDIGIPIPDEFMKYIESPSPVVTTVTTTDTPTVTTTITDIAGNTTTITK
jgi:toxin secretion/phage lysis holin